MRQCRSVDIGVNGVNRYMGINRSMGPIGEGELIGQLVNLVNRSVGSTRSLTGWLRIKCLTTQEVISMQAEEVLILTLQDLWGFERFINNL